MANKTIPDNYNAMDGKVRNIIETIMFDGIYIGFMALLSLPFKANMYLALMLIPITVWSFMGIGGQSLITALRNYIRFIKRRRVLGKPSQEYIREKNRELMLKKQKEATARKDK